MHNYVNLELSEPARQTYSTISHEGLHLEGLLIPKIFLASNLILIEPGICLKK